MLNLITKALFILWPIVFYTAYKTDNTIWAIIFILVIFISKLITDIKTKNKALNLLYIALLLIVGFSALFFNKHDLVLIYPVCISAYLGMLFTLSLFTRRSAIEHFARLKDKYLTAYAIKYTKNLTKIWIIFFIINGSISLATVLNKNIDLWFLYNGFLSYIALGLLIIIEIPIRLTLIKRQENMLIKHDFFNLFAKDRHLEDIVFFDNKRQYTILHVQYLIYEYVSILKSVAEDKIIIKAKDNLNFCASVFATLICKKTPVLCSLFTLDNMQEFAFLDEVDESVIDTIDKKCQLIIKKGNISLKTLDSNLYNVILKQDNLSTEASFILYTSGSTGKPKEVIKSIKHMLLETHLFVNTIDNRHIQSLYSTVLAQHLYGLSFAFFMPLLTSIKIYRYALTTPESLSIIKKDSAFITSPSLLSNLDYNLKAPTFSLVMSAGGRLENNIVKSFYSWAHIGIQEIYGSTETGIIATRLNMGEDILWNAFKDIKFMINGDCISLTSPLFDGVIELDDKLTFIDSTLFKIEGRKDKIIKIGEKRFSLNMIESIIKELSFVKDVYVLTLNHNNIQRPACVIALYDLALVLKHEDKVKIIKCIKEHMQGKIDRLAIPRWYRFVDKIPVNEMGKRQRHVIEGLFNK